MTHPRIYAPPTPLETALDQVDAWIESPSLVLIGETRNYWNLFRPLLGSRQIVGPRIHDARVAAICREHGILELWSADRDFSRFSDLPVRNPLVG